ncbi:MAG: hypothetical protein VXY77_01340 [Pseudomonadota bacterium]|nr:hypothetical protein [Pseudomonadota bacterium]
MHLIAIICGGPGPERGISLNSARSLFNHLDPHQYQTRTFFVDPKQRFFLIDSKHLLSNTPDDFSFKIQTIGTLLTPKTLKQQLSTCDLAFHTIHGIFGEDGQLPKLLESFQIPFVGSSSETCLNCYQKSKTYEQLKSNNLPYIPTLTISKDTLNTDITAFWTQHHLTKVILKPNSGGSSIGVHTAASLTSCQQLAKQLCQHYQQIVIQPFYQGRELTIMVLEHNNQPVALLPTETERMGDEQQPDFLDYRSKYLPSNQCRHHTPARYPPDVISMIRQTACELFKTFNLRDMVRFDGWWDHDRGFICNDINIITGLEENSFIFKQACLLGLSHTETLDIVVHNALKRYNLNPVPKLQQTKPDKKTIQIIFGGENAERQVSLMSGRHVWLQLQKSEVFKPIPWYLNQHQQVRLLSYHQCLHHTVEEIDDALQEEAVLIAPHQHIISQISEQLNIKTPKHQSQPSYTITQWAEQLHNQFTMVFIALHGGLGEDGTLQNLLESYGIPYQGSQPGTSKLCMDKISTQQLLKRYHHPHLVITPQVSLNRQELAELTEKGCQSYWTILVAKLNQTNLLIKPRHDGCSTGIVQLTSSHELYLYAQHLKQQKSFIVPHVFKHQPHPVALPHIDQKLLIEPYICTDTISLLQNKPHMTHKHGWIEITCVIIERQDRMHAYSPSITISENSVLSVEEKFQGGTGTNLTPPPIEILTEAICHKVQQTLCDVAAMVGIKDYARIDAFVHTTSGKVRVIEVNTLPALTPSTVLFQQALAEKTPLLPHQFLEYVTKQNYHPMHSNVTPTET